MDKLDEILRQLASGEITPDQAKKVIKSKPKRGRPPKKRSIYTRLEDGSWFPLVTPAMEKARAIETPRVLAIGKYYVDQIESDIDARVAMSATLKKFSTKRNHIELSTVSKYATLWRKRRNRDRIRRNGMIESIRKGMEELHNSVFEQVKKGMESLNDQEE